MKRLLFVITGLGMGGAEVQVVALAKALQARGWEIQVASLTPPGPLAEELQRLGITVISLGLCSRTPHPRSVARLVRLVRSWRPQVVHSHMFHANVLARLARPLAPVPVLICTAHNTYEVSSRAKRLREVTWREWAYRLTDSLCDLTTQISHVGLERYVRVGAVPHNKIRVVPNGVDTALFYPDQEVRHTTRAKLGVGDLFVWLAVGRIEEAKDYPTLVRALATLLRESDKMTLVIVGEGSRGEEMKTLAGELRLGDRVRFLGIRRDVPRIMGAADGYVMSSSWEGLPMVLLEAQACGLPVVTTAVGGCAEVVQDGRTGFLVPPQDPNALAQAMLRVMALPEAERRQMSEAARRHVVASFSLDRVVDEWEGLFAEQLAAGGPRPHGMAPRR